MKGLLVLFGLIALAQAGLVLKRARPGGTHTWDGEMFVQIDESMSHRRSDVLAAIDAINQSTNFRVSEGTPASGYVSIKKSSGGCSSFVGKTGQQGQSVMIGDGCPIGSIVHELMHAAGVMHEHVRSDRNQYVVVGSLCSSNSNYVVDAVNFDDFGPYDVDSLMHYPVGPYDSSNDCIRAAVPDGVFGRAGRRTTPSPDSGVLMSSGDIAVMNHLAGDNSNPGPDPGPEPQPNPVCSAQCSLLVDRLAAAGRVLAGLSGSASDPVLGWSPEKVYGDWNETMVYVEGW